MLRFKFTYQDRALNKHIEIWRAKDWTDAIVLAFSLKKAEWTLLKVECLADEITRDDKFEFNNWRFICELEQEDLEDHAQWPKENPYVKEKKR